MKIISKISKIAPLLFLTLVLLSCSNDDTEVQQELTIVETALATPNLSSLVAALQRADGNLVSVLNGDGPFTVLAPTNEAFTTFLSDNGFASLEAVPTDVLAKILLNHVISGEITSTDLITGGSGYANTSATGPSGNNLSIYFNTSNGVRFNGVSSVTTADISASNGIVHVVDAVIGLPTVVDFALANPNLSNLVAALQSADSQNPSPNLIGTLSGTGPFTVFAPTDAAFGSLLTELGASGLGEIPPSTVQAVLTYHVVSGNVTSSQLTSGSVATLGGNVTVNASNFTITDPNNRVSNIITSLVNIQALNGVVHAIDKVILPPQ